MHVSVVVLCVVIACACVRANVFLHNPRGSNNRYDEVGPRDNANRLFNSQNNAQGGYAWGPSMSYVEGSILPIQWTSAFGCGSPESFCTEVIQYMCTDTNGPGDVIRDGTTTNYFFGNTDPNSSTYYNKKNADGTYVYGLHESLAYAQECYARKRNTGLYTGGNQNLNVNGAMVTRQNPGGLTSGTECNEERDYYPYWHPSPWKDIAVITSDPSACNFYKTESQNVKDKFHCTNATGSVFMASNNAVDCANEGGAWRASASFGLPPPECITASPRRSLDSAGTSLESYKWTLPSAAVESCIASSSCNCLIRVRYNVTSDEATGLTGNFPDYRNNATNNPDVTLNQIGDFTISINSNSNGRVFQDRAHMFHIIPRPANLNNSATIYNLNVRGKRGNKVQIFPALEYAFVPSNLEVRPGDYVHFQWTGSDNYTSGTDRSNVVQIASLKSNFPVTDFSQNTPLFDTSSLRIFMALLGQTNCTTNTTSTTDITNCALLNGADRYFNGGLIRMNNTGTFAYMCTRNNYFSTRAQKGKITVTNNPGSSTGASSTTTTTTTTTTTGSATTKGATSTTGPQANSAPSWPSAAFTFIIILSLVITLL